MSLREVAERAEQYMIELLNGRRQTRGDLVMLAVLFMLSRPVSYTHLTLPTNREV